MVDASQPGPATGRRAPAGRALALLAGVLLFGVLALGTLLPGLRRLVADSVVRIAYESEPLSLDPHAVQESATHGVLSNFYEPLATYDADMKLVPALAVRWESTDELTWIVQLRPGVRFHDGRLLTAQEVQRSLERARDRPESLVRGHLAGLESVEALDTLRVRLRTRQPDALLLDRLTYVLLPGVSAGGAFEGPVGTGPYRVVRHERGKPIEAKPFTQYWGPQPSIARARFTAMPDAAVGLRQIAAGQLDVLRWVPDGLVAQARQQPGVRIHAGAGLGVYYLWLDTRPAGPGARNPLADARVRRAISTAIDRTALVEGDQGLGEAAHQLVPRGLFGHVPGLEPLPHDPSLARALLRAAGYPGGLELTLVHRPQEPIDRVALKLVDMLAEAGIRLRAEARDWPEISAAWNLGQLSFFLAGWGFESADAGGFYADCLVTRHRGREAGGHNAGYSNPELDGLVLQLQRAFGAAERARIYKELARLTRADMPLVPLYNRRDVFASRPDLRWQPRVDGQLRAAEMSFSR